MLDDMGWCRDPAPRLPRMAPAVADAILSRAAALGMRSSVHAPNLADARAAVAGGATLLAHGVLDRFDEATIARMKSRPVYYVPTMDVFEFLADTRAFVDGVLARPRRHATRRPARRKRSPATGRRSTPTATGAGIPTSRTSGASSRSSARTCDDCTPPESRSRSAPTCGLSRAWARRSSSTCS